jgi:hypothetical protein
MKIFYVMVVKEFDERFKQSFASLLGQDYPVENIFLCSESPYSSEDLPKLRTIASLAEVNQLHSLNVARKIFMKDRRFDALLTLEADVVIPKDAVRKLVEGLKGYDQIGVTCRLRKGNVVAMKEDPNDDRPFPSNVHSVANIEATYRAIRQGLVIEVDSVSFNCTLFTRKVIEQMAWGWDDRFVSDHKWFFVDSRKHHFRTALHGGVWARHLDRDGTVWEVGDIMDKPFVPAVRGNLGEWGDVIGKEKQSQ